MRRTGRILAALVLVGVLLIGAVLVYRSNLPTPTAKAATPAVTGEAPPAAPSPSGPAPVVAGAIAVTADPDEFARAVTAVVFGMDARTTEAADYRELLLAGADPQMSASGVADLAAMVDERIPADDLWARMRANEQYSQWVPGDVWEPGSWEQVVTSGQAEAGWAMRNVTGQQTTHYVEAGQVKSATRERTITIGMRCPAPGAQVDSCKLVLVGTSVVP
ncbi:hypothetical protein [Pengzhenrongella phosphoraccumulans]|uniref:hypothetical protein n=1 Tax=Pengzhenrongella phosphoraccumulans TaxID=3114394 RepID=UPI00388ECABC